MKRCLQTAEIINEAFDLPLHHHEGLRERCFGKLNGKVTAEIGNIEDYDPEEYEIERRESVMQRAVTAIEDSLRHYPDDQILFVSHGGIFQVVHDHFCQEIKKTKNAVPHRFYRDNDVWRARLIK